MTKCTPGPWTLDGLEVVDHDGRPIAAAYTADYDKDGPARCAANARLLAAAPELLAALRSLDSKATEAIAWLETLKGGGAAKKNQTIHAMRGVQLNARAAIDKAAKP